MKEANDYNYILTLTVRNRPGVLVRCAQVLSRRGHSIQALQVMPMQDVATAQMTITAFGHPGVIQQITAQLLKVVDILDVHLQEA